MSLPGVIRPFVKLALLLCAFLAAPATAADEIPANSHVIYEHCHAPGQIADDLRTITRSGLNWNCEAHEHSLDAERTYIRFTLDPDAETPRYLLTRRSPLQAVHVITSDASGAEQVAHYGFAQLQPSLMGGFIRVPLENVTGNTASVIVAIDKPTHVMTLDQTHLASLDPGDNPEGTGQLIALAGLCGMLLMPLIFNLAFFRVLREPFVLWHATLTIALMLTIVVNSGLSLFIIDLSVPDLSRATSIVFGFSVAAAGMFAHSFIEPDRLNPAIRKALPWAALWIVLLCVLHANFPFVGRTWQTNAYYAACSPVLFLYIAVLADGLRRGSRAARYQLVGWLPLIAVGVVRLVSQLTPIMQPTDAMLLFYFGCVFEVMATSLGVADRFMTLKKQRDRAQAEAQMLERISERDGLTGLYNRRFLEEHFGSLRAEGFTALALLDLDHFKAINDSFGHATGDDVLRGVARALQQDDDTIAVRLGGEEFALLLRGANPLARAEFRRQAIMRIIAGEVSLDRTVTASMGLVEMPNEAQVTQDFETVYRTADRLLYEAKATGRNRTLSERLKVFAPRRKDRRAAAA